MKPNKDKFSRAAIYGLSMHASTLPGHKFNFSVVSFLSRRPGNIWPRINPHGVWSQQMSFQAPVGVNSATASLNGMEFNFPKADGSWNVRNAHLSLMFRSRSPAPGPLWWPLDFVINVRTLQTLLDSPTLFIESDSRNSHNKQIKTSIFLLVFTHSELSINKGLFVKV